MVGGRHFGLFSPPENSTLTISQPTPSKVEEGHGEFDAASIKWKVTNPCLICPPTTPPDSGKDSFSDRGVEAVGAGGGIPGTVLAIAGQWTPSGGS